MRLRRNSRALAAILLLGSAGAFLVLHPSTPLPKAWNPIEPIRLDDPVTLATPWKLDLTTESETACLAALPEAFAQSLPPLQADGGCGIDPRVKLIRVGQSRVAPVETTCSIALRMALWERHSVQPAARYYLGADVSEIMHFFSFSCRNIRTPGGGSNRLSTHATAEAIDVSGFRLSDGRRISLLADWGGLDNSALFLRAVRDGACDWFETTLGPDYNSLHADHFHLQSRGWGTCR